GMGRGGAGGAGEDRVGGIGSGALGEACAGGGSPSKSVGWSPHPTPIGARLRPDGGMIAKRDRRPCPIGWRLRQLNDRFEVPQWTGRGLAHRRPAVELRWRELGGHVA